MASNESGELPKYRCGNCKYMFLPTEGAPAGYCRRYPPTAFFSEPDVQRDDSGRPINVHQTTSQFPIVVVANWCGEHKKMEEPKGRASGN